MIYLHLLVLSRVLPHIHSVCKRPHSVRVAEARQGIEIEDIEARVTERERDGGIRPNALQLERRLAPQTGAEYSRSLSLAMCAETLRRRRWDARTALSGNADNTCYRATR
jgi:hypothetical protein